MQDRTGDKIHEPYHKRDQSVATSTITVDCCNSDQVGQVTFSSNSRYNSRKKVEILFILNFICPNVFRNARVLGFEPRSKVLETSILPLNYTRVKQHSQPSSPPNPLLLES